MNDYQKEFFSYLAEFQERSVQIAMSNYKEGDDIENLLYDTTYELLADVLTLIDGYSAFSKDKLDIVNQRTGQGIKNDPFIELHDCVCGYLKCEKFPSSKNNA